MPGVAGQRSHVAHGQWVAGDHHVCSGDALELLRTVLSVEYQHAQLRREALSFSQPVLEQAGRHHDQAGAVEPPGVQLGLQQGQCLQCLAKPHVVGQHTAETGPAQEVHPRETGELVRSQLRLHVRRHCHWRQALSSAQLAKLIEQLIEGRWRPQGQTSREGLDRAQLETRHPCFTRGKTAGAENPAQPCHQRCNSRHWQAQQPLALELPDIQ